MSKSEALIRVVVAYIVALLSAIIMVSFLDLGPLLMAIMMDVIGTLVIFGFGRYYSNSSFYDPYWSVVPPAMALFWMSVGSSGEVVLRELAVLGVIFYWATRLTLNWAYFWEGMNHEDWRYEMLRSRAPKIAVLTDLVAIHLIPTTIVFMGMLPVFAVFIMGSSPFSWIDILAVLVGVGAVSLQMISDFQLRAIAANKDSNESLAKGLWAWSRHPNYFGELGFWLSLFLFGISAHPSGWIWQILGVIGMTLMFLFASIPMMEKRSLERREGYQDVIDNVSMLIPLPPKRNS